MRKIHPMLEKLLGIVLLGTAFWIIVSEIKIWFLSIGLSKIYLWMVAIGLIYLAWKVLGVNHLLGYKKR